MSQENVRKLKRNAIKHETERIENLHKNNLAEKVQHQNPLYPTTDSHHPKNLKKSLSYAQLDWMLKGRENKDLRYFNREPREMLGSFCKGVMEDALEEARERKRESAYDVECGREEAMKYSHDILKDMQEAIKSDKIHQVAQKAVFEKRVPVFPY